MLYVLIEHFLNDTGKKKFKDWMELAEKELSTFAGFLKLEQLIDIENTTRSILLLQFDTLENLRFWSQSQAHIACLGQLEPYMLKKQKTQLLEN